MDRHAGLVGGAAIAADRDQAVDEIGWRLRDREWAPTQLRRRRLGLLERRRAQHSVAETTERLVHHRGPYAVGPGAAVLVARRREGGAGNLLGIKAERGTLRAIAPDRQRAGDGLGLEMIAESGLVGHRAQRPTRL